MTDPVMLGSDRKIMCTCTHRFFSLGVHVSPYAMDFAEGRVAIGPKPKPEVLIQGFGAGIVSLPQFKVSAWPL